MRSAEGWILIRFAARLANISAALCYNTAEKFMAGSTNGVYFKTRTDKSPMWLQLGSGCDRMVAGYEDGHVDIYEIPRQDGAIGAINSISTVLLDVQVLDMKISHSSSQNSLAVISKDGNLYILDILSSESHQIQKVGDVTAMCWSTEKEVLVIGASGGDILIINLGNKSPQLERCIIPPESLSGHRGKELLAQLAY